jgi:signal peptidase I
MQLVVERAEESGQSTAKKLPENKSARMRRMKVLLAVLLPLVAIVYFYSTELIPSESMLPTLKPGDQILTLRAWIAFPHGGMPARDDIVLFHTTGSNAGKSDATKSPHRIGVFRNEGDILIKRVVGLPGETVEFHGSEVFINGVRQERNYAINPWRGDEGDGDFYHGGEPVKLGPDELFVMGDNRDNSDDSRFWGPLKREHIVGKFVRVLFHRTLTDRAHPNRLLPK